MQNSQNRLHEADFTKLSFVLAARDGRPGLHLARPVTFFVNSAL
jgi:hypothetical protein